MSRIRDLRDRPAFAGGLPICSWPLLADVCVNVCNVRGGVYGKLDLALSSVVANDDREVRAMPGFQKTGAGMPLSCGDAPIPSVGLGEPSQLRICLRYTPGGMPYTLHRYAMEGPRMG